MYFCCSSSKLGLLITFPSCITTAKLVSDSWVFDSVEWFWSRLRTAISSSTGGIYFFWNFWKFLRGSSFLSDGWFLLNRLINLSTILFLDPLLCDSAKASSLLLVGESIFDGTPTSTRLVGSATSSALGEVFCAARSLYCSSFTSFFIASGLSKSTGASTFSVSISPVVFST